MRQPENLLLNRPPLIAHLIACLLVVVAASPLPAQADARQEVARLMQGGQTAKALQMADRHLNTHAQDAQMRLLKGVLLAETGKTTDAIQVFKALTAEYPQLPEPHNNLAVLYARQKQFDKAQNALEMAFRTNPSYATALTNLGDINAQLANQAYAKALQLDTRNAVPPPRLSMIVSLSDAEADLNTGAPKAPAASQAAATAAAEQDDPPPARPVAQPTAPAASTAVSSPATAPTTDLVMSAVKAWANAWAAKDMGNYFASYSKDFVPTPSIPRINWENERKQRILNKSRIEISISEARIKLNGNSAIVSFLQHYRADGLVLKNKKTLNMVRDGSRWLISKEVSGT